MAGTYNVALKTEIETLKRALMDAEREGVHLEGRVASLEAALREIESILDVPDLTFAHRLRARIKAVLDSVGISK